MSTLIVRIPKHTRVVESKEDNAYRITQDWVACVFDDHVLGKRIPDYTGLRYKIENLRLIILRTPDDKPSGIDGATGVPDFFVIDLAPGFIPHDLPYMELERQAADPKWIAAGWDIKSIRMLWDGVFAVMIKAEADAQPEAPKRWFGRLLSRVGYAIVRLFGGIYHNSGGTSKLLLLGVTALILSGCCNWAYDSITPTGDKPPYVKTCQEVK